MSEDFEIDITPSVTTYELYQIASYTHWFSIGEFIDNSITSAIQNREALIAANGEDYRLRIQIELDHDNSTIKIIDNAAGIERNEIQRALRAGEAPADRSLLSVHGVGMKMSAFWLGRNLKINTWPLKEQTGYDVIVDLDDIKRTRSAKSHVTVIAGRAYSGTTIEISKISEDKWPMGRGQGKLRTLLASMYRLYLNDEEFPVSIVFNGRPLQFTASPVLVAPYWSSTQGPQLEAETVRWERPFDFTTSKGRLIHGRIALLEKMSRDMSGFFLHFRGKGMAGIGSGESSDDEFSAGQLRDNREYYRPHSIFGQEGSYRYQRFTGEFDISSLGKTSSTDSIKWNEDEQQEFLDSLEKFLKNPDFNMWAMAENYQVRKARRLLEESVAEGGAEFTLEEISEISSKFLSSVRDDVVTHDLADLELETAHGDFELASIPRDQFLVSEISWTVRDSSGHNHVVTPEFIEEGRLELFDLTSSTRFNHELKINLGHPFIRRFQWANRDVRLAIITMIYLMAMPEVLLPLRCSSSAFRRKMFEIINSTLNEGLGG